MQIQSGLENHAGQPIPITILNAFFYPSSVPHLTTMLPKDSVAITLLHILGVSFGLRVPQRAERPFEPDPDNTGGGNGMKEMVSTYLLLPRPLPAVFFFGLQGDNWKS